MGLPVHYPLMVVIIFIIFPILSSFYDSFPHQELDETPIKEPVFANKDHKDEDGEDYVLNKCKYGEFCGETLLILLFWWYNKEILKSRFSHGWKYN